MHHVKSEVIKQDGKRRGRGFSREELKKADISPAEAKRLKLPVDMRRKTAHDQNVEAIKAYANKKKAVKPKQKPQPQPMKKAKK